MITRIMKNGSVMPKDKESDSGIHITYLAELWAGSDPIHLDALSNQFFDV